MISIKKEAIIFISLSASVLIYTFYRAFNIDITYDEAWTIKDFVPLDFINILNYSPCDANNHILNTLLIKFIGTLGGKSLFFARLPNFLSLIGYLYFSYKISKFVPNPISIILFILLLINPFLLDFFSLARGYGMGIFFQTASIFYLFLFIKRKELKHNLLSLIFASLACLSNFSQLNYWIALTITIGVIILYSSKINKLKFILYNSIIAIIFLLIIYEPVRKLVIGGNLYYGGNNNFYSDTLLSLTKYTQYSPTSNQYTHVFLVIFLLSLLTGISFLLIKNFKNKISELKIENSLLLITFLAVLSPILQHYLLGTLYLIDRTALFYYPLFILLLCFSLNLKKGLIHTIVLGSLTLIFCLNFIFSANLYKTAVWYFDSHTRDILSKLNEKGIKENRNISIDFSWPFQSSVYYYYYKNTYPNLNLVKDKQNREEVSTDAEYYIYLSNSLEKVGYEANTQKILPLKKDTLFSYETEGIYIFEK